MKRLHDRLTFANVTSCVALFVALGGVSYAATELPANSVGGKQIKKNAVTGAKIAANAVTSSKIEDGSLLAKDFASGQLPAGAEGPKGDKGDIGPSGPDGAAIAARVRSTAGVDTPPDHSYIAVPLGSNTWTQGAGELDLGPFGHITYTAPAPSSCGGTGLAYLSVEIDIDSKLFSSTTVETLRDGATRTAGFDASGYLFEPGAALAHTATAKVSSSCESGVFAVPIMISDLRFDVIRAS